MILPKAIAPTATIPIATYPALDDFLAFSFFSEPLAGTS